MNKILALLAALALTTSCCESKPEKRVHKLLMDRMLTLSVAESCTGGAIASRFTAMPGASAYFKGGAVAYWNQTKSLLLNVSADTIARYGVVSEQVVRQMAEGARRAADTHYAIATTGMAGSFGGTPEIPSARYGSPSAHPNAPLPGSSTSKATATGSSAKPARPQSSFSKRS